VRNRVFFWYRMALVPGFLTHPLEYSVRQGSIDKNKKDLQFSK
jgi:hypothetical protein